MNCKGKAEPDGTCLESRASRGWGQGNRWLVARGFIARPFPKIIVILNGSGLMDKELVGERNSFRNNEKYGI